MGFILSVFSRICWLDNHKHLPALTLWSYVKSAYMWVTHLLHEEHQLYKSMWRKSECYHEVFFFFFFFTARSCNTLNMGWNEKLPIFKTFEAKIFGLLLQFRLRTRKVINMVKVKLWNHRDQLVHGGFNTWKWSFDQLRWQKVTFPVFFPGK